MSTFKGWMKKGSLKKLCPPGRRRKGRPRNLWMQKVTTRMREKGINNLEWVDREKWREK